MRKGNFVISHSHFRYDNEKMLVYSEEVGTNAKVGRMMRDPVLFTELIKTYIETLFAKTNIGTLFVNEPTCWFIPKTLQDDPDPIQDE